MGSTLTITPATLTVLADPFSKIYGTSDPTLAVTTRGLVNTTVDGVTIDDTAATVLSGSLARAQAGTLAGEQVGGYTITQGTLATNGNYTLDFTGNTLNINPAAVTVSANPQTKVYGAADPSLTYTATGFINTTVDGVTIDDPAAKAPTGDLARAAGETVSGGPYAINQGTLLANNNYTISFTGNALAITPASLTIVADPETKVFGSADPMLGYTSSGFQFLDTAATVLTGSLSRTAGETVSGSPYAIGQGTLTANSNYTIHFTGSSLSVTPATPVVTVSDAGGTYSGAAIAATAKVTGINGDIGWKCRRCHPDVDLLRSGRGLRARTWARRHFRGGDLHRGGQLPRQRRIMPLLTLEPATFVIAPVAATVTLTSSSSSPEFGQAVTFVATDKLVCGDTQRYRHVLRRCQSAGHGRTQRLGPGDG